jgi:hypothetical protein
MFGGSKRPVWATSLTTPLGGARADWLRAGLAVARCGRVGGAGHQHPAGARRRPATADLDTGARTLNRLKGSRRVATRYERREVHYLAMVTIAAIVLLWLE